MIFKFILTANEDLAMTLACQEYWQQYHVMNQQFLILSIMMKRLFSIFSLILTSNKGLVMIR